MAPITYLFSGLEGFTKLVPVMKVCVVLVAIGTIILVTPPLRKWEVTLAIGALATFLGMWLEKVLAS